MSKSGAGWKKQAMSGSTAPPGAKAAQGAAYSEFVEAVALRDADAFIPAWKNAKTWKANCCAARPLTDNRISLKSTFDI
jgi:hypothetical protein